MSEYLYVKGGNKLYGRVKIHGAKNAVLPLLALGMLTDENVIVEDCPNISDVDTMSSLLKNLGLEVVRKDREICVSGVAHSVRVKENLVKDMRSSMFMLGALLCACKEVNMPLPGGCVIGARPMDIHFDGLKRMGATVDVGESGIHCIAENLHGADIVMKYASVGATENLLMCASRAKGTTRLINCAREPEIVSLVHALRIMGARISGEGTSVITIEGVPTLSGCRIRPISDRIVAGTIVCAVAICGGEVLIENGDINTLQSLVQTLNNKDCAISGDDLHLFVKSTGRTHAMDITSAPYPLFATDLQPQALACACFADGVSKIRETVFENRFAYAEELKKFGFDINIQEGRVARVSGCNCSSFGMGRVCGAEVYAKDLRGGASLLLASLGIKGASKIYNPYFIDRGYERIEDVFCSLGAYVKRVK